MSRLVRLFPRPWRDRYEDEFLSLLADRPLTVAARFDIVSCALDAHLRPQVRTTADAPPPVPDADARLARRLGVAAVIGGAVWPAAWAVAATGPVVRDAQGSYVDGSAALPISLLAVGLLSAGLIGQIIRLPLTARVARGSAALAIPFIILFGSAPWLFPIGAIGLGCLAILAISGRATNVWPTEASFAVVAACVAAVVVSAVAVSRFGDDRMAGGAVFQIAVVALIPIWLAVGATLIRRPAVSGPPAT